jgi:hypothetical protein
MGYPLAGIRAKIERGQEHLTTLDAEIKAFGKPEPYTVAISQEGDPDHHVRVFRYRVLHEPPLRFGILAGEAVQQFRSALDHLALQLAQLRQPRIREANFPIYTDKTVYTTKIGAKKRSPRDVCRRLFRPEDLARLERLQPYNEAIPNETGLAILQRLSNVDKHAVIHTPFSRAEMFELTPHEGGMTVLWENPSKTGIIDDDTPLLKVRFKNEPSKMQVSWLLDTQIVFGEEVVTFDVLDSLKVRIVGIVDEFEGAIPKLGPTP